MGGRGYSGYTLRGLQTGLKKMSFCVFEFLFVFDCLGGGERSHCLLVLQQTEIKLEGEVRDGLFDLISTAGE